MERVAYLWLLSDGGEGKPPAGGGEGKPSAGGGVRFWDACTTISPVVEPVDEYRAYLGWQEGWAEELYPLVEKLGLEMGAPLLGAMGSSKVVARGAVEWLYDLLAGGKKIPTSAWQKSIPGWERGNRVFGWTGGPHDVKGWWLSLAPQGEGCFWASLPVRYLWPLPEEARERLIRLGLHRIGDVVATGQEPLHYQFGVLGEQVWRLAKGEGPDPVRAVYPSPTLQRRLVLPVPVRDARSLAASLKVMGRELATALQERGLSTRRLELEVEWESGTRGQVKRQLLRGESDPARLVLLLSLLWERLLLEARGRAGVQEIRITLAELEPSTFEQLSLFPASSPPVVSDICTIEKIEVVRESLRRKYAREVISRGKAPTRRQLMLSFYTG